MEFPSIKHIPFRQIYVHLCFLDALDAFNQYTAARSQCAIF